MTWIYAYPAWAIVVAIVVTFSLVSVGLVQFARRFGTASPHAAHNDVAGPISSVTGTLLAILLSFMLVTVWQEYDQAAQTSATEAAAVGDLYQTAVYLPTPARVRLQEALRQYVATLVDDEWPRMRSGGESPKAKRIAESLLGLVAGYEPADAQASMLQGNAIALVGTVQDSRRDRLFDNQQGIPSVLYAGILLITLVTLALCGIFTIRSVKAHVALGIAVATVIAIVLALTAEFDYPFRGEIQIPPTPWMHVAQTMLKS